MTKRWLDECWRLALGVVIAAIAGLATGKTLWVLVLFLLLFSGWMIYRFHEIEQWLRDGGKSKRAPDTVGIASEIMQLIHREKKFSSRQKDRLRSSLTQFNDMAAELPDATIVLGKNLQIRWCNAASAKLLGVNRRRDGGQRIDNLIRSPEFHKFLTGVDEKAEIEIVSPVNNQITVAIRRVQTTEGTSILTGRDISQRVRVRDMRKAFVADVSHELRTPLTVIHGYHEMLIEEDSLPPHVKQALQGAAAQSARMSRIVNDLLTLSRLESSVLGTDEGEHVHVHSLIESLIKDIEHTSTRATHRFIQNTDSTLTIIGKENEIYSACQNLVQNGVKYTEPGTSITIGWNRTSEGALLSVTDTGQGIASQHLSRISERFYRVDKDRSREKGGTGLGLAIVKYIAQRHGGELSVSSEPGVGSQFNVLFPPERIVTEQGHPTGQTAKPS